MAVPKLFTLNGYVVKVEFDNTYLSEKNQLGEADFNDRKIKLCDSYQGDPLSDYTIEVTFYHELAHHLLDNCGKGRLKYNEAFVDKLGMLIYEFMQTKK